MIKVHCDFCGQIIDTKKRYFELDPKGPDGVFGSSLDVCPDCFDFLKNNKEYKDAN